VTHGSVGRLRNDADKSLRYGHGGFSLEIIAPLLPAAQSGGRPRTTDIRAVVNAIFYLLRTGCQWQLLPREFPAGGPVCQLPPNLEERGRMDMPSEGALRARSNTGGVGCVPVRCHYGSWPTRVTKAVSWPANSCSKTVGSS
jgi:hypothetical protein